MPFVAKEEVQELETLRTQNERMAQQLSEFEEMKPHLLLAEEIRNEIVAALENNQDGLDARSIAEKAYSNVLRRKVDEARDEVAARYEQEHRRTLYERVLGEVATTEGDDISKHVQQKVETDPELAVELRNSARKELAARATDVVRQKVTAEQQAVINYEADRQIELDRLDVKFAVDGELDLDTDEVRQKVKPGDRLVLFCQNDHSHNRDRITLVWVKDANGKEGWVFEDSTEDIANENGREQDIDQERFITIGVLNKDLENGKDVIQHNKLAVGRQPIFAQKDSNGKLRDKKLFYSVTTYDYYSPTTKGQPYTLIGTDFQTKNIQFFSATAAKAS